MVIAIPVLCAIMQTIHRHYAAVRAELRVDDEAEILPSRVHGVVLVSGWNKATQRAIAFARASRPDTLSALTVNIVDADTRALTAEWQGTPAKCRCPSSNPRTARSPDRSCNTSSGCPGAA